MKVQLNIKIPVDLRDRLTTYLVATEAAGYGGITQLVTRLLERGLNDLERRRARKEARRG